MFHKLQSLAFSSGKRMRRLSHSQISESDIHHQLEFIADVIYFREKLQSVFYVHMQYFVDAFPSPLDSQDLCLIPFPVA